MKNQFLTIALFLLSFTSFSQYAIYNDPLYKGELEITLEDYRKGYLMCFEVYNEDMSKSVYAVKQDNHQEFMDILMEIGAKYEEWTKVAKDNNVKELMKDIKHKPLWVSVYFRYGNSVHRGFDDIQAKFMVDEEGYVLVLTAGSTQSNSNQFIQNDFSLISFRSKEDFDTFLSLISVERAQKELAKPKAVDLFNN